MYISLFLPLLLLVTASFAQTGMIRGHLTDTVGLQVLKGALVVVRSTTDSTVCVRNFSKDDASFIVASLPYGDYLMQISFQGYEPVRRLVHVDRANAVWDVGKVNMHIRVSELDSVRVEEPPMLLKKDTLIFNSSRFGVQPYAPVGNLLEELPGVRVNPDGSITVNGQTVDRLLVDGMPFFTGDPKLALQHLPAEIIRQIQVYASQDERSALAGMPNASGNKTMNLIVKNDRRHGDFGKIGAGAGPDGVYAATVDLNHLNGKQQLSVAADGGNVDGLTSDRPDAAALSGPGMYGITRRWKAGVNYKDLWNPQTSAAGSFVNNQQHTEDNRFVHSLFLFPGDSTTILEQKINSTTNSDQHRLDLTVTDKLNDLSSLIIKPNIVLQHTKNQTSGESYQVSGQSGAAIYQSVSNNTSSSDTKVASADLVFLHKSNSSRRSFSTGLSFFSNHNQNNSFDSSRTSYSVPASTDVSFNQHVISETNSLNFSPSITYSLPAGKRDMIDLQGEYQYNDNRSENQAFRFNDLTHQFDRPDSSQSINFRTVYQVTRLAADYRIQRRRLAISLSAGVESDRLKGIVSGQKSGVNSQYTSFLPGVDLSFQPGNGKNLHFSYNGKPAMLTLQQLQPVTTTSDSLFIQEGNPWLRQPFIHSYNFSYSSMQAGTQRYFSALVSGSMTVNAIQTSVTLLPNGAQVFKPVNMNGAANINATANYTIPQLRQHSNIGISGNIRYSQDPVLSNGITSKTHTLNISGGISYAFYTAKNFGVSVDATSSYNSMFYPQTASQPAHYFTETLSSRVTYAIGDWVAALVSYYTWNSSLTAGYQPKAPLLSPMISRRLFTHKQGEIKLYIADVLDERSGASRTVSPNMITDLSARIRGRYALISFTYNVSRFKTGTIPRPAPPPSIP